METSLCKALQPWGCVHVGSIVDHPRQLPNVSNEYGKCPPRRHIEGSGRYSLNGNALRGVTKRCCFVWSMKKQGTGESSIGVVAVSQAAKMLLLSTAIHLCSSTRCYAESHLSQTDLMQQEGCWSSLELPLHLLMTHTHCWMCQNHRCHPAPSFGFRQYFGKPASCLLKAGTCHALIAKFQERP